MGKNNTNERTTNIGDVIVAILDFLSNLITLPKISALCMLYVVVIQNVIMIYKVPEGSDYSSYLVDTEKFLEFILNNGNTLEVVFVVIIIFLLTAVVSLIIHTERQRKHIETLCDTRKDLMHGLENGKYERLKKHRTSKRRYPQYVD